MKVQLTKTKTIELRFPGGGGASQKASVEMVGVEIGAGAMCPAVRILRRKNTWQLLAASPIARPSGELPMKWDDLAKQPMWELPREFQSTSAALTIRSSESSFGQASGEAIVREMAQGLASQDQSSAPAGDENRGKFRVRREEAPAKVASAPRENTKLPSLPSVGTPVAENGRRFVIQSFAEEGFYLRASLPEYQVLWLSRLLPEGRRPTASSVQVEESALMASVLAQPFFAEAKGDALVIFVRPDAVFFAGYRGGENVLWRRCPAAQGEEAIRAAVRKKLGVEEELVDAVLDDSLVDPRPAIDPLIQPILEQLDLSRAYLTSKFNMTITRAYLFGLSAGANYWLRCAEEMIHLPLFAPDPFEGFAKAKGLKIDKPQQYLVALGAALAAAGGAK